MSAFQKLLIPPLYYPYFICSYLQYKIACEICVISCLKIFLKISSNIHFVGDHDDPSYSLLPPHQTLYGSPFRCRIIIHEMNNRWAYVCVY